LSWRRSIPVLGCSLSNPSRIDGLQGRVAPPLAFFEVCVLAGRSRLYLQQTPLCFLLFTLVTDYCPHSFPSP